ncbi:MAG: IgGFc binding protein [Ignavibacteria bacterium]|nr:IgGFc binding protein [Ignavibacteria bacterium]
MIKLFEFISKFTKLSFLRMTFFFNFYWEIIVRRTIFRNNQLFIFLIISFILLNFNPIKLHSQEQPDSLLGKYLIETKTEGKEFWICFQPNHSEAVLGYFLDNEAYKYIRKSKPERKDNSKNIDSVRSGKLLSSRTASRLDSANVLHLELFIASDNDAIVTIEIEASGYKKTYFVAAGTVDTVVLDSSAYIKLSEEVDYKSAIHITSNNPITVYGLNRRSQTTDTFLALPIEALGTEYRVMCYSISEGMTSQFAIVATEDSTEIIVNQSIRTNAHNAGIPYSVEMNKGDVYQVVSGYYLHLKGLPYQNTSVTLENLTMGVVQKFFLNADSLGNIPSQFVELYSLTHAIDGDTSLRNIKFRVTADYPISISGAHNAENITKAIFMLELGSSDLTGSLIQSNKKVAVFSGHRCAYVPDSTLYCNHLVEQMPPINTWGKHFFLGKFHSRNIYNYRVLASMNETKVFENDKLIRLLNRGEYFERTGTSNLQITADKPVLVAQYSQGSRYQYSVMAIQNNTNVYENDRAIASLKSDDSTQVADTQITRLRFTKPVLLSIEPKGNAGWYQIESQGDTVKVMENFGRTITIHPNDSIRFSMRGKVNLRISGHSILTIEPEGSNFLCSVQAIEKNTNIYINTGFYQTLKSTEFVERAVARNVNITTDKPAKISKYSMAYQKGDTVGDPMMLLISPTQQFLAKYRFTTPIQGFWQHFVNLVVPTTALSTLRLNGFPVDISVFEPLGLSRYSLGCLQIPYGTHVINCSEPFGLYSYGFGYNKDAYDAYGTMGGQSFKEYVFQKDTLAPMADAIVSGDSLINIIFRDDRVNDLGNKSIYTINRLGMDIRIPEFTEGVPQVPAQITIPKGLNYGFLTLAAKDIAGNSALYTACFNIDAGTGKMNISFRQDSKPDCPHGPELFTGIFGNASMNFNFADFSNTGNIKADGKFGNNLTFGGWGGALLGMAYNSSWNFCGALYYENYQSSLAAKYSVKMRNPDDSAGGLIPFTIENRLNLKGGFINLGLTAEYLYRSWLYFIGGIVISFNTSDEIEYKKYIIEPDFKAFSNGERSMTFPENQLSSLKGVRFGINAGVGTNYPLTRTISAFAEIFNTIHLGSLVEDSSWWLNQLTLRAGLRVRLKNIFGLY